MYDNNFRNSLLMTFIMLMTSMLSVIPLSYETEAAGTNQTTSGTLTGTETWSGSHSLTGDVEVGEGALLIINAGTTINVPAGSFITIKGAMCAGKAACGATQAGTGSPVRFVWPDAISSDPNATGRCYDPTNGMNNRDLNCGEGLIFKSTIDTSLTALSYVTIDGAYGYPSYIQSSAEFTYSAITFDGASFTADNLNFNDVNTSSVMAFNLAAPLLKDSTFKLGSDGEGWHAAAVRAFGAGAGILSTFILQNSVFTGDSSAECGRNEDGRSLITASDSYIDMNTLTLSQNAYGLFLKGSSGQFTNSQVSVKCNGVDTNGHKSTGDISHTLWVHNNTIITEDGAPLTAYDQAIVNANDNILSGASEGSGIAIRDSTVNVHRNIVGPITGWNGMWILGDSEVVAENNTFEGAAKETILIGEYHFRDSGWNVNPPTTARIYFANNIIRNNSGIDCNSATIYGGDFLCPAIHVFMSSGSFIDNVIESNAGDGIRVTGGIVNFQGNEVMVGDFAARVSDYDDDYGSKYGSIAFFSDNIWTNATQIYNVSESRVAVQSEHIPNPGGAELYPVQLSWSGAECPAVVNECLILPPVFEKKPKGMPLSMNLLNNATTFTFADLTNFDLGKVHIQNQNSAWGVQVQKGELVRFRTMAKGNQVGGAYLVVTDAIGNELYNFTTDDFGYTPQFTLPSNFHIDTNWNHLANDPGENSCNDGIDNDGDANIDSADSDCESGREKSTYSVWAYKFEKGLAEYSFVLSTAVDDVLSLANLEPSLTINQPDGFSFKRIVEISGTGWDGVSGPYFNDIDAQWSQQGVVRQIQIKPPGVLDWDDAYFASDNSGSSGVVNKSNHPFSSWSYEWDMSNDPEGDYTFEIRAFDGLDYSPTFTRIYKLNTIAPTILIDSPANHSSHDDGSIIFIGRATDPYSGIQGSDIDKIWFRIVGPDGVATSTSTLGGTFWSWEWDFSPLVSGEYEITIWASDSDFCKNGAGECLARTLVLNVDTDNDIPFVQISDPYDTQTVTSSSTTMVSGISRDTDGQVTKVEFTVTNQDGLEEQNHPDTITMGNIREDGYWQTTWDTSNLLHGRQYTLAARSFDGYNYSPAHSVTVEIDNPPEHGNIPPVFNATGWVEVIRVFCDSGSNSVNQCGDSKTLNLSKYFSDEDQPMSTGDFIVVDNPAISSDDHYGIVITITTSGIATFDTIKMRDYSDDISEWSLKGVQFQYIDASGSKATSLLVDFHVESSSFTYQMDGDGNIAEDGILKFSGEGRPGAKVTARIEDGQRSIGETTVGDNGLWTMEISGKELNGVGSHSIVFEYSGVLTEPVSIQVGDLNKGVATWMIVVGILITVVILGAMFVFFFVEFEEFGEEDMDQNQDLTSGEDDPYAWAKQAQAEVATPVATPQPTPAPQPVDSSQYPGWMWDAASNEWVPDPNHPQ